MHWRYLPIAALVAGLALGGTAFARDWTGVWVLADSPMDKQDGSSTFTPGRGADTPAEDMPDQPELTPIYLARRKAYLAAVREAEKGGKYLDVVSADCKPVGMPRFWGGPYAFEIVHSPRQINLYQEAWQQTRRIYLDGRGHPGADDADPTFLGHSIGHWEGKSLVVDTVQFREDTKMTFYGADHSADMRIRERFTESSPGYIDVVMTVEDPKALVKPWVSTYRLHRKDRLEAADYFCENNRNPLAEDGSTTTKLGSPK